MARGRYGEEIEPAENDSVLKNEYPFLQNLSHEVRTPMNAIIGISDLLMSRTADVEEREQLVSLKAATQNLLMVINNIIDYDEMAGGKLTLHRESTDLEAMVADIISMARINIGDRDVLFVVELNPVLPKNIILDVTRAKQALVYFLTNAAKCTKWGYIALSVDYSDNRKQKIRFKVENTDPGLSLMSDIMEYVGRSAKTERNESGGINIYFDVPIALPEGEPEEKIPFADERYYGICIKNDRERSALALYFKKAGIRYVEIENPTELFILKENERPDHLILEHDKYRRVKDIKEFADLGTKLICLTDFYDTDGLARDAYVLKRPFFYPELNKMFDENASSGPAEDVFFEGARVLVVDDNAINLKVTSGLLAPYRLTVDKATGGEEAIRMIHRTRYDLVFMDHMMPEMDGTEATLVIRQARDEYFKNLPIVALSANVTEDSRKLFKEAGMNDFLAKPIELDKLREMLIKWIPKGKQQRGEAVKDTEDLILPDLATLSLSHINTSKGLSFTGGNLKMYISVLEDFKNAAPLKKSLLTSLVSNEDVGRYTIEVHSLKSLAATIGAGELNFIAAELEKKGHQRDMDSIVDMHNRLIGEIEDVENEIGVIVKSLRPRTKKIPLLREKAGEILRDLFHAMDEFDYDSAEATVRELEKYEYDSLVQESYEKLKECVDRIDYESTKKQAIEMIALL